ncbi:MAG: C45 family autoproteolytic acyltransferase/hydrolase [Firmicutes bacterium]|nr:C45 family autoproteolytic acyltransferase/hydrolase [Bacillota bacterium]
MRRHLFSAALALALALASLSPSSARATRPSLAVWEENGRRYAGQGWREERNGITVVHFKGTHREIGAQNYLLLASEALELRDQFNPLSQPAKGWDRVVQIFKDFYMRAKIAPGFLRHTPPEYVEEMKGFVQAAEGRQARDLTPILLPNVFAEIGLVYGCTSFAAFGPTTADGSLYHGRNLDFDGSHSFGRYAIVAIYEPEGSYPFIALTYPANIGVMQGMNIHSICVSMSYSKASPEHITTDGIGYQFLLRQVLERAATLDDAVEIIRHAPRTIGLDILVSDAKIPDARVIEVAADRYQVRTPGPEGAIWATNRYETPWMQEIQSPGWLASEARDARLRELFAKFHGAQGLDLESSASILRDRHEPGTRAYDSFTIGINNPSSIATVLFAPAQLRMWAGVVGDHGSSADGVFHGFDLLAELGLEPRVPEPVVDILPIDPNTPGARDWWAFWEATYQHSIGNHARVRDLLLPVLAARPESQGTLRLLGRSALFSGDGASAEAYFRRIVELDNPTDARGLAEAWFWLGYIARQRGQTAKAAECFESALAVRVTDVSGSDEYQRLAAAHLRAVGGDPNSLSPRTVEPGPAPSGPAEPASAFEGLPIREVTIIGAAQTSADLIRSRLSLQPGQSYREADAELTARRLAQLRAFETVKIVPVPTESGLDVVVRVHEGFGWYRDPVESVIITAADLLIDRKLALSYENLAGSGVNLDASYRLGTWPPDVHAGIGFPLPSLAGLPIQLKLGGDLASTRITAELGENAGSSRAVRIGQISAQVEAVVTEHLTVSLGAALRKDTWEDNTLAGLLPPAVGGGAQVAGSAGASWSTVDSPAWPDRGTRLAASAYLSRDLGNPNEADGAGGTGGFGRLGAEAGTYLPIGSRQDFVLGLTASAGWTSSGAPFHRLFIPGPGTGLRIAVPILPARAFLTAKAEIWWEASPTFRFGAFAEAGAFGEHGFATDARALGAGIAASYLTPVGASVTGYAALNEDGKFTLGVKM